MNYEEGDRVLRRSRATNTRNVGLVAHLPGRPELFVFWHERGPASTFPDAFREILGRCDAVDWFFLRGDKPWWRWPAELVSLVRHGWMVLRFRLGF